MLSASQSEKTSLSAVAVSPTTSPPSVTSSSSSKSDSKPVTFTPSASPHTSPVSPTHHREAGPPLPAPASPALITDSSIDQSTARPTHSVVVDAKKQPHATSSANLSVGEPVSSCDDALISSPSMYVSIFFLIPSACGSEGGIYLRLRNSRQPVSFSDRTFHVHHRRSARRSSPCRSPVRQSR